MPHTLIVGTTAIISICLHFMRDSLANIDTTDDFRTGAVLMIEDVCMCFHAILAKTSRTLHLQSTHFIWQSFCQALALLELELFPGVEPLIPANIEMPTVPLKLTVLVDPDWTRHHVLLSPAHYALFRFRAWVSAFYDISVHGEVIEAVDDCMLLLEAIADICQVRVEHPPLLCHTDVVRDPVVPCT